MRIRRRESGNLRVAIAASLAIHLILVAAFFLAERAPRTPQPRMRVYAVNIVSPPPNVAGEPPAEPPAPAPEPGPAAATPEPAPPAPAPSTPAPPPPPPAAPEPTRAPPREPEKAPAPRREPERTTERPKTETPRRETPRETPRTTSRETNSNRETARNTEKDRPRTTEKDRPRSTEGSSTTSGRGTSSNTGPRSTGTGNRGQATGRDPDPDSPGGEGLSLQSAGMECPSAGYCENIVRQVRRYFRRPEGENGSAEACFRILEDGSVDRITVRRVRGSAVFRLAVSEAVEQAGLRKAFGELPAAFGAETLPVCVDITPQI